MDTPFEYADVQETPMEEALRVLRDLLSQDKLSPEDRARAHEALGTIAGSEPPLQDIATAFEAAATPDNPRHRDGLQFLEKNVNLRAAMHGLRSAWEIEDDLPQTVLRLAGKTGAVLSVGQVCILSGEGGVAKSALACDLALGIAAAGHRALPLGADGKTDELSDGLAALPGQLFHGLGGKVLILTYEDPPAHISWRLRQRVCERDIDGDPDFVRSVLSDVVVLNASRMPLFGPTEEGRILYNSRPGPLPGMDYLREALTRVEPTLVIIDPALCAYVGDSNGPAPVREFLGALCEVAQEANAGVLALAHSTKAARGRGRPKASSNREPSEEQGPDIYDPGMVAGSAAWTDGVRGAMTLTWHPSMEGHRVLGVSKSNWGPSRMCNTLKPLRGAGDPIGFEGMGWVPGQPGGEGKGKGKDERRSKYDGI